MKRTHRLASDRPLHRKLQGSNIFDGFSKIDQGRSLLACTTRMFEILIDVTDPVAKPKPASSGSVRTTPVHRSFRTHILAASTIHFSKNKTVSRRIVADNFRCLRRVSNQLSPDWGGESYRRFLRCQPDVENFFRTLKASVKLDVFDCRDRSYRHTAEKTFVRFRDEIPY